MSVRVVAVMPEPTPYRTPLFDVVAARPEVDLTVIYSARAIAGNSWDIDPPHPHVFLRGVRIPGAARILRHDYPVTFGIVRELARRRPQCVVITGWSTFASQAAIAWCRARRVPYLLIVESHDEGRRRGWRRRVKRAIVPHVIKGAAGVLVAGSLARRSVVRLGADPRRIGIFANTVDVGRLATEVAGLAPRRGELRERVGAARDDVVVLCVARLAPEKRIDVLLRAARVAGVRVVLVGDGPLRSDLESLASELGVAVTFAGVLPWDRLPEVYAAADVFALLSDLETWGVVVNEAAAAALPLVLSHGVGSAADLLRDGENGVLVPTGDVEATAAALERLARDPKFRSVAGARSRAIVAEWGYEPSANDFVRLVVSTVAP